MSRMPACPLALLLAIPFFPGLPLAPPSQMWAAPAETKGEEGDSMAGRPPFSPLGSGTLYRLFPPPPICHHPCRSIFTNLLKGAE